MSEVALNRSVVLMILGSTLFAGCQPTSKDAAKSIQVASDGSTTIVEGSTPSEEEKMKLVAAKEALFAKLSGRLMEAMSTGGPASAIDICQKEAPAIALDVAKSSNVKIGRVGVRLRNVNNQPPNWAKKLVANKTDTPTFVKLSDQHAAALIPIKLQAQCLICHGSSDTIAPDVQEKLAKLYPQDKATGFSEGELRGWFWVESID